MEVLETKIKAAAEAHMRERPAERVFSLEVDSGKFWVKRKLGNGRKQLVKYSVEKEFFYEIARMTIAARNCPELVPEMTVLTPDYMVTRDGGPTIKVWLDKEMPEEDKESLLEQAGAALARLHEKDIVHGRPALRDITWDGERMAFLDWEIGCMRKVGRSKKPLISFSCCKASAEKTIRKKKAEWRLSCGAILLPAIRRCCRGLKISCTATHSSVW